MRVTSTLSYFWSSLKFYWNRLRFCVAWTWWLIACMEFGFVLFISLIGPLINANGPPTLDMKTVSRPVLSLRSIVDFPFYRLITCSLFMASWYKGPIL